MKEMEKSITLIGLPGCGKTTVGNLLSDKLNYEFIDMDFYIEDNQGKTIIELFKNGEDYLSSPFLLYNEFLSNFFITKNMILFNILSSFLNH